MSDMKELKSFSDKLKAALEKKRVTLSNRYDSVAISDKYKIEFDSLISSDEWIDCYMLVPVGNSSLNPKPVEGWKTHSDGTRTYILPPKDIQNEVLNYLEGLSADAPSFKELRERQQKDAAAARETMDFLDKLMGQLARLNFEFPEHFDKDESVLRLNDKGLV
jgi:hypothetical protein